MKAQYAIRTADANAGVRMVLGVVGLACILALAAGGCTHHSAANEPKAFNSPEAAADALVAALRMEGTGEVMSIMGSEGQDIVSSGDNVADSQRRQTFLRMYKEKHALTPAGDDERTLVVGETDWPFPVPIVKRSAGWEFDAASGKEEVLNRRIGQNELDAIQVCRAIADAQREYAVMDPDRVGAPHYAQRLMSDPGKRDGLFWPTAQGEEPSPMGDLVASAAAEAYTRSDARPIPYHGYYYRLLRSQGPNAPGGQLDYVVNGKMTLGYAVLARPAEYGNSGIMTFMMGTDGVVYQKDLGPDTERLASSIGEYDPDDSWTKAQ